MVFGFCAIYYKKRSNSCTFSRLGIALCKHGSALGLSETAQKFDLEKFLKETELLAGTTPRQE